MANAVVKEGRVMLRDAGGSAFSVPEEQARAQLAQGGYRLETPEEYEGRSAKKERSTIGQEALTAGEGALDTATLGLGTAAAVGLGGEDYRKAAQERAQFNPTARLAGQVAGAVAPAFIPGGQFTPAGLVGRAGGAVERGAGGLAEAAGIGGAGAGLLGHAANRAIALGAAGAAEGAAYGLGGSLADSALEGTDWTADRALHGLTTGALYGLAGGAALGAGEAVAARAGRKVIDSMIGEGKTLKQAARDFADRRLVSAATDDAKTISQITRAGEEPERLGEIADKLRARGASEPGQIRAAVSAEAKDAAAATKSIASTLDAAGVKPSGQGLFDDLEEQAGKLEASGLQSDARLAGRLRRELQPLRNRLELPNGEIADPTFGEAHAVAQRLEKLSGGWSDQEKDVAAEAVRGLADSFGKRLDEAAASAGEETIQAWQAARRDQSDFSAIRATLKNEPAKASGAGLTGFGSSLASLVLGHTTPVALVSGLVTGTAHKLIAERGSRALGWISERVAGLERASTDSARELAGFPVARSAVRAETLRELAGDRAEHFEAIRSDVQNAFADPAHMVAKVHEAIGPAATEQPEVAQAMGKRIVEDYKYLHGLMPPPITSAGATLQPQKDQPKVPREQQKAVVSAARALRSPGSVMRSLAAGNVDWDAIDALKTNRHDVWNDFRTRVALSCAEEGSKISYSRKVMLGTVFDFPSDPSMLPGVVLPMPTPAVSAQGRSPGKLDTAASHGTPASQAMQASEVS